MFNSFFGKTTTDLRKSFDSIFDSFDKSFEEMESQMDSVMKEVNNITKDLNLDSDGNIVIYLEAPGFEKADIKFLVTEHFLTAKGKKSVLGKSVEIDNKYLLLDSYDRNAIKVTYSNGLFKIFIPKGDVTTNSSKEIKVD